MEVKSSMGVIVAAPTAGSCGALPGAIIGMATSLDLNEDEIVKAMLAAGLIGVFVAAHATFAAEVGGCMAECGSGSGMAAAALVGMANGSLAQSLSASFKKDRTVALSVEKSRMEGRKIKEIINHR